MTSHSEFRQRPEIHHTYDGPDNISNDPLPDARHFRLLKLLPAVGEATDRIEIELEVYSLDSPFPSYTALTYTWRSEATMYLANKEMDVIFSRGRAYGVTDNLRQALWHLRSLTEIRYLWVDQLCIRQTDEVEKSQQIPLMKAIYQSAREGVTAWLGSDDRWSPQVLQYISHVTGERLWDDEKHDQSPPIDFRDLDSVAAATSAMIRLLSRPWFSRIWVIQEASVQKQNLAFRVGHFCFSFQHLLTAVDEINRRMVAERPSLSSDGRRDDETNTYFLFLRACPAIESIGLRGRRSLQELVQSFCSWDATNPRDKIYALMGLANDTASYPAPNYSRLSGDVYRDFAQVWLASSLPNVLHALTFAASSRPEPHLPSWVTNWRSFGSSNPISPLRNNYKFQAGGMIDANAAHSFTGQSLSLNGLMVDKICKITSIMQPRFLRNGQWLKDLREVVLLSREGKVRQTSRVTDDSTVLLGQASPVPVPHERTEAQQAPQEKNEPVKGAMLTNQQQRNPHRHLSEAEDLANLLVLDGQSSLYQLVGQEMRWFDIITESDLPALKSWLFHSLFSFSSHTHSVYKGPVTKYPELGVNHLAMRFENPSTWPDLSHSRTRSEESVSGTDGTSQQNVTDTTAFEAYRDAFWAINVDQRVFLTEKGRIGMANDGVSVGDHVTVLQGGRMPFITKANAEPPGCRIISEAYVRGIMHGECVEGRTEWETIVIV